MELQNGRKIPERLRQKMLRVIDDDFAVVPILWQMTELTRLEDVLDFLISARITGKNFVEWYTITHEGSVLSIASWSLKYIRKDDKPGKLYLGRDWKE